MSEKCFSDSAAEGNVRETVFLTREMKVSEKCFSDSAAEESVREKIEKNSCYLTNPA